MKSTEAAQAAFETTTDLMVAVLSLAVEFLQEDKQGKNAVDVAKQLLMNESIKQGIASVVELVGRLTADSSLEACTKLFESRVASVTITQSAFLVQFFEALGDAVKFATPNLKKKKDPAIDEYRALLKPLTKCLQDLAGFSDKFAEQCKSFAGMERFSAAEWKDFVATSLQLTEEQLALLPGAEKRISQLNGESKSTLDRFIDAATRLSKRLK